MSGSCCCYRCACACVRAPPYIRTCMHACMHACIHTYKVHTYIQSTYVLTYMHTCIHTHTHTHTHTHDSHAFDRAGGDTDDGNGRRSRSRQGTNRGRTARHHILPLICDGHGPNWSAGPLWWPKLLRSLGARG